MATLQEISTLKRDLKALFENVVLLGKGDNKREQYQYAEKCANELGTILDGMVDQTPQGD